MAMQVCMSAQMMCTFGAAPSSLVVLPKNRVLTENLPAANIMDHIPMVNIMPFGMCNCPSNPAFIAATAAKAGVATPVPCVPVTVAPWVPGSPTVLLANFPALNNTSKCMCTWGGVISITNPGQTTVMIP